MNICSSSSVRKMEQFQRVWILLKASVNCPIRTIWHLSSFLPTWEYSEPRPSEAWDAGFTGMYRACLTCGDKYNAVQQKSGLYVFGARTGKHKSNRDGISCKYLSVIVQVSFWSRKYCMSLYVDPSVFTAIFCRPNRFLFMPHWKTLSHTKQH